MKRISKYSKLFIILLLAFFALGIVTLGSFRSTGDSMQYKAKDHVAYQLSLKSDERLAAVYVNVGAIYADPKETTYVGIQYTTSKSQAAGWTTLQTSVPVSNGFSKAEDTGSSYNWIRIAAGEDKTIGGVKRIRFAATSNLELCELVCLNADGEKISLLPSSYNDSNYSIVQTAKTLDGQNSFTTSDSAYNNFSKNESAALASVNAVLSGKSYYEGSVYTVNYGFNYFSTVLLLPTVALFGNSPFAVRLAPFIATCCILLFVFLIAKLFFKKEKNAFSFTMLLMGISAMISVCSIFTSVAHTGGSFTILLSALLGSVYFACRFLKKPASFRPTKDSANVLYSGLFASAAMAMQPWAVLPAIGVAVLLWFGLRKQNAEYTANGLQAKLRYKNRIGYGFAALSFIAVTFVLLISSGAICATAVAKSATAGNVGFAKILWQGIKNSLLW